MDEDRMDNQEPEDSNEIEPEVDESEFEVEEDNATSN